MCECDSGPQAFHAYVRKARKEHKCCECYGIITKGNKYEYASGVWDEGPNDYKTCLQCVETRQSYIEQLTRYDCLPCFGELFDGWAHDDIPAYAITARESARERRMENCLNDHHTS